MKVNCFSINLFEFILFLRNLPDINDQIICAVFFYAIESHNF